VALLRVACATDDDLRVDPELWDHHSPAGEALRRNVERVLIAGDSRGLSKCAPFEE
jgi:hypothetical protein